MGERCLFPDLPKRRGQGFGNIAEDHVIIIGDAVRMRGDAAVENEYIAVGEQFTQMIIGATVSETEFEDRTRNISDQLFRKIQAVALRRHPADKGIQPAQVSDLPVAGFAQLRGCGFEPMRQFAHDFDSHPGKFADHSEK